MQIRFYSETDVIIECAPGSLELFRDNLEKCHPVEERGETAFDFREFLDKLEVSQELYNPFFKGIELSRMLMLNCVFDEENNLFRFLLKNRPFLMQHVNPSEILEKVFNTGGNTLFFKCYIRGRDRYVKIRYITNDFTKKYFSL